MFEVTIYVETSFTGPALRTAAGMWLIEYIKQDGDKEVRSGMVCGTKMKENALALEALTLAFSKLKKGCFVRVNTGCQHILNTVGNGWLPQWEKNDWATAKNKMVKNVIFWKKIAQANRDHVVKCEKEFNSYEWIMQDAMKKGLELREKKDCDKVIYDLDLKTMIFTEVEGECS